MTTQMGMDLRLRSVVGVMAAGVLLGGLTSCGEDAEADAAEATGAVEGNGAAEGADAPSGESDDADDGDAEQAEDGDEPEPVPASSDGPAENWPEPEVPEEASEQTEEGVEAALQHWFETLQYARNAGDVEPLLDVSYEGCDFCLAEAELVEDTHENGWFVQELDEIDRITVSVADNGTASAFFLLDTGTFEIYWNGVLHDEGGGEESTGWSTALIFEEEGWAVADLLYVGGDVDTDAEELGTEQ